MNIPNRMDPLGNGVVLPVGYTRIAYLESTGAQWISVNVEYDSFAEIGACCEYVDLQASQDAPIMSVLRNGSGNNRFYVPYCAKNTIYTGFYDWITLGQGSNKDVRTVAELNLYASNMYRISYADVKLEGRLPSLQLVNVNNMPMMLFGYATLVDVRPCFAQVFYALITKNKVLIHKLVPVVTTSGEPRLFDTVSGQSFYNVGSGAFIVGVETQKQLDMLLHHLPDRSGMETGMMMVRLADTLGAEYQEDYINSISIPKNWNIAYAV